MLKRSVWPWIAVLALVYSWAAAAPCSAQSAASPVDPATRPEGRRLPPPPSSTVSPAIERFVKQRGMDLPPPAAPSLAGRVSRPAPIATQDLNSSEGRVPPQRPAPPSNPTLSPDSPSLPNLAPLTITPLRGAFTADPIPLAMNVKLKPAPLAPNDLGFPINLATALRLSDARPLVVAYAQASVWVAEADLTHAKALWVPTLNFAVDYVRHDGGGPDFNKGVMTTPASVNFLYGGPGLTQFVNLTDAIFEPVVARQVLTSRHWDVQTSKNDVLRQTANAYFGVHEARGTYSGALYAVELGRDLVTRIERLNRELVPRVEADRARNVLAELEQRATEARQRWRVQSANLTQVLRLDPRAVVEPLEHDHAQITLVDPGRPLDDLMLVALTNRPELGSQQALIDSASTAIRREKSRMLLPNVVLGGFQSPGQVIQGGFFTLGPNSSLNQTVPRADVSVQLIWQLENMGIGNLARIKAQRGRESQARIELRRRQDEVVADITRSHAMVQAASARVLQAERALRTGLVTFYGHLEGLGQTRRIENVLVLSYRPQEAVYSLVLLNVAFNEYFATVADYNRAQFELFHALGYPARELAALRSPGEALPVDTNRPPFLPPVGNGPPPASR